MCVCVCVCGVCVRHPPRRSTPSMVRTRSSVAAVVRQVVALSNNGKKIMLDYNLRTGFNSDLQNGPHRPQVYSRYASPHTSSAQTQPSTSPARASFHARLPSGQALDPALCGPRCTASPSLPSHTRCAQLHPHMSTPTLRNLSTSSARASSLRPTPTHPPIRPFDYSCMSPPCVCALDHTTHS